MSPEAAEIIALKALQFIAGEEDESNALAAQTGAGQDELREGARNLEFLGSILDFILSDEDRVLRFCEKSEIELTDPAQARRLLPGAPVWD